MESRDYPIPKKKNKKQPIKKHNNEGAKADPSEVGRTYGIDRLSIGEAENESENSF